MARANEDILIGHDPDDFRRQAAALLWGAILIACLVLVFGWGFKIDAFMRVLPIYPAMVPGTALCIISAAVGTLRFRTAGDRFWPLTSSLLIVAVICVERFTDVGVRVHGVGEAMSRVTVVAALLAAAALMAQSQPGPRPQRLATQLDTVGLSLICLPLLGYLFDSEALWGNIIYTKTALHTAIGFFMVFAARLLLRADQNWVGVLFASERGSQMGRRILPVVILGPIVLSYLALIATQRDILTADFRLTIMAFLIVALGTYTVVSVADRTNQRERSSREWAAAIKQRDIDAARSEKIALLGRVAGGVAHDFNNLLTVIIGNLELLEEDDDAGNRVFYTAQALQAANNAVVLTSQLLTYGRKSLLEPVPVLLDDSVADTVRMFQRIAGQRLDVTVDLALPGHQALLDPANFQQVLLNILINARDAMPEGGTIVVETRLADSVPPARIATHEKGALPDRAYLRVAVRDNGTGMAADVLARALEPYYTTKGVGEGSGLGLSMAQGFCRQSGGDLRISSTPGQGTAVTLYFPMCGLAVAPATRAIKGAAPGAVAPSRILVVDDEDAVTQVIATQLTRHGYEVVTARDGNAAMAVIAAGPLPALVITDVVMPGEWQGQQLASRIKEVWPAVLVLLMSGHQSNGPRDQFTTAADFPFVQKPISQATLLGKVAHLLAQG